MTRIRTHVLTILTFIPKMFNYDYHWPNLRDIRMYLAIVGYLGAFVYIQPYRYHFFLSLAYTV